MGLVRQISAYAWMCSIAVRTSALSILGSIRIAGSSIGSAPRAARRRASSLAWARARVTTTRLPCSGRRSSHAIASRRAATGPTSVIAGGRISASEAASAIPARSADTVRWSGRVPRSTTIAG